jgi:hypothetical protein
LLDQQKSLRQSLLLIDRECHPFDRKQVIAAGLSAFQAVVDQKYLAAIIYFTWAGLPGPTEDASAIFRCGALTDAGTLALSPM